MVNHRSILCQSFISSLCMFCMNLLCLLAMKLFIYMHTGFFTFSITSGFHCKLFVLVLLTHGFVFVVCKSFSFRAFRKIRIITFDMDFERANCNFLGGVPSLKRVSFWCAFWCVFFHTFFSIVPRKL